MVAKKPDFYAIDPQDRETYLQLIDWWRRQSQAPDTTRSRSDNAVPMMLLDAPDGWTQGRYVPLMVDSLHPYSYDVCLIGYPKVFSAGTARVGTFKVKFQGVESGPIQFTATAQEFRAQLPPILRDNCVVTGGAITDVVNGITTTWFPGRWFVSLAFPVEGIEAVPLYAEEAVNDPEKTHEFDSLVLRVSQSAMSCGQATFPCWGLVNRTTAPRIAVGSLALGWYVQGFGLMVGVIEPRIYESYQKYETQLLYPTTTTTAAPTTTTSTPTTTTATSPPTTTTTSSTTTTTAGPTTTTTATPTTTTTAGGTTTTTEEALPP